MYPNYELMGVLRSLSDYTDFDDDYDPESLIMHIWDTVKETISNHVKAYVFNLKKEKKEALIAGKEIYRKLLIKKTFDNAS